LDGGVLLAVLEFFLCAFTSSVIAGMLLLVDAVLREVLYIFLFRPFSVAMTIHAPEVSWTCLQWTQMWPKNTASEQSDPAKLQLL
jgi:hypothetical protein